MTINPQTPSITYQGNGVTTNFTFTFDTPLTDDIELVYTDSTGSSSVIDPSLYTLVLLPPSTGHLWSAGGTLTYPNVGSPIASGTSVTIIRKVPYDQGVSISNQGAFYPRAVEQGLDLLDMQTQQLKELSDYSLRAPLTDTNALNDMPGAADRANGLLGFDPDGQPVITTASSISPDLSNYQLKNIALGTLTRPLVNEFTDEKVNLLDYGTGTGAAGQTVGYQAAFQQMLTTGVPVFAPNGTYLLDSKMVNPGTGLNRFLGTNGVSQHFTLYGSKEPGGTVFTIDQNYIFNTCSSTIPRIVPFYFKDFASVDIRDITVDMSINGGAAGGTGDVITWTGETQYATLDEWDGKVIYVNGPAQNTGTSPTFAPYDKTGNLLAAMPIVLPGGQAINVGNTGWPAKTVPYWGTGSKTQGLVLRYKKTGSGVGYWEWNYWMFSSPTFSLQGTILGSTNVNLENVLVKNNYNVPFLVNGKVVNGKIINCTAERVYASFGLWLSPDDNNEDLNTLQPQNFFINNFTCHNAYWGGIDIAGSNTVLVDGLSAIWDRPEEFPSNFATLRIGDGSKNAIVTNVYGERTFRGIRVTDLQNGVITNCILKDMYGPGVLFNEKDQTNLGTNTLMSNIKIVNPCRGVNSLTYSGNGEDGDNVANNYGLLNAAGSNNTISNVSVEADVLLTGLATVTSNTASTILTAANSTVTGKSIPCFDRTIPLPYYSLFFDATGALMGQSLKYVAQAGTIVSSVNSTVVNGTGTAGLVQADIIYDMSGNEVGTVYSVVGQTITLTANALVTLAGTAFQTSCIRAKLSYNSSNVLLPPFGAGTGDVDHCTQQLIMSGNSYTTQANLAYSWRYEGVDFVQTMDNNPSFGIPQPTITVSGTAGTAGLYTSFSRMVAGDLLFNSAGALVGVISSISATYTAYAGKVLSTVSGSAAVTGTGFNALTVGMLLVKDSDKTELGIIKTITDDNNLVLAATASSTVGPIAYDSSVPTLVLVATALRTITAASFGFAVLNKMGYGFGATAPTTNFYFDGLTCTSRGHALAATSFASGSLSPGILSSATDVHPTGAGYGISVVSSSSASTISYNAANVIPSSTTASCYTTSLTGLTGITNVTLDKSNTSNAYVGLTWRVENNSSLGTATIKNGGGSTLVSLGPSTWGVFIYDGTNYNTVATGKLNPYGTLANALTAAGTTRADALQLTSEVNIIGTAAANTGVILFAGPTTGLIGSTCTIYNNGANPIKVYAPNSITIDGVAGATGVTLTNDKRCQYLFTANNTCISAQLGVISA